MPMLAHVAAVVVSDTMALTTSTPPSCWYSTETSDMPARRYSMSDPDDSLIRWKLRDPA